MKEKRRMRDSSLLSSAMILGRSVVRCSIGRPSPTMLILEPTLRCNSRCITCYNRKNLNQPGADLDVATCRRIAADLPDLLLLEISGGEPSLHKELPDLIAEFVKATPVKYISIPTNAIMPDAVEKMAREVCNVFKGFVSIGLSMDGIGETHDAIRGVKGNFDSLQETYRRLVVLKKIQPNLHISVNTCICSQNESSYRDILGWVADNWPEAEGHSISLVRAPGTDLAKMDCAGFLQTESKGLTGQARLRKGYRLGLTGQLNRLFWGAYYSEALKYHRGQPRHWRCSAGSGSIYIDAFGSVHTCELREPIGSLRYPGTSLSSILNSAGANRERLEIDAEKCSCDHSCFLQHSAFTRPGNIGFWWRGLMNSNDEGFQHD